MQKIDSFYNLETLGGTLLFIAAVCAILIANSPMQLHYHHVLEMTTSIGIAPFAMKKPILSWINDGLMAIYFLLIGLEIKREIHRGVLSQKRDVIIPAITAACGMFVPALLFILCNYQNGPFLQGWAIPTATDIAFTLGILALLGSRVPLSLKILLTAVAIFDDMGAILIIALFYTQELSLIAMISAGCFTLLLFALNYFGCRRTWIYILIGVCLWISVLKSGVHATIAGIILAMTIPDDNENSMLEKLENRLHPWIVYLILPLFAFANAGFPLLDLHVSMLTHPIVIGTALGLFLGKQIGVFIPLCYFVKVKGFLKADNITLRQVYGIALLCGVGFTMSLFIGTLAYQNNDSSLMPLVKVGVMLGSLFAGTLGYFVLRTHRDQQPL